MPSAASRSTVAPKNPHAKKLFPQASEPCPLETAAVNCIVLFADGSDLLCSHCWWQVLAALSLVALLLYCWHYRVAQVHQLAKLRQRLAEDLHDDIGANLSQLTILSEVLRHQLSQEKAQTVQTLESLTRIARETVSAMGDIVWATNPTQDYLPNLTRRMRRFASEILPAAGIEFTFRAPASKATLWLDAELRRQVFLIFKESLNNLVRHSGCTQAAIELRVTRKQLWLQIRDNGQGFECAPAAHHGNGLPSLRHRAQSLGAHLDIASVAHGTTITLQVRLARAPWRAFFRRYRPRWGWQHEGETSHLNRGVTAPIERPTIASQPIKVAAKKAGVGH